MNSRLRPLPGMGEGATEYQLVCPIGGVNEQAVQLLAGTVNYIDLILLGPGNQQIHIRYMPGERIEDCVVKDPHREYVHIFCGTIHEIDNPLDKMRIGRSYGCNGGFGTETTGFDIPHGTLTVLPKE